MEKTEQMEQAKKSIIHDQYLQVKPDFNHDGEGQQVANQRKVIGRDYELYMEPVQKRFEQIQKPEAQSNIAEHPIIKN